MVKKIETNVSPAFSLKGWNIIELIKRNKDLIKTFLAGVIAFGVANPATLVIILPAGVIGIIAKATLDIIDFYTKEVKL
jgi:ammonia channel protein AmtB